MYKIQSFLLIPCILFLTGCASIVSDSEYRVHLNSTPSESDVVVEDHTGRRYLDAQTPATVVLGASDGFFSPASYTATFKNGNVTKTQTINAGLDGWYVGNILFGGVIGLVIVDPATGAMWSLDQHVHAHLGPNNIES